MIRLRQLSVLALVAAFCSCSRNSAADVNPPVTPPPPDSLSAGWARLTAPSTVINDIFFASDQLGYIASNGALYRSDNAGNSWARMTVSIPTGNLTFGNIGASEQRSAFTAQSPYTFYSTNGTNVQGQLQSTIGGQSGFSDVFFASVDTVFFSSGQYIWRSLTGGADADTIYNFRSTTGPENALYFLNGYRGWVMRAGRIHRTTDGGLSWTAGFDGGTAGSNNYGALSFFSAQQGFFTVNGRLYRTDDAGATATQVYNFGFNGFVDIHFFNAQNGYACAGNRVYRTTNGGSSWTTVATTGTGTLVELHFVDATHGWAAGNGALLRFNP
ncbi:MAG: hypothetical protein EOO16_16560 [Chitinophagaceae bacterium]|nr:MAG: hypothetical protein EOO16_16560 [Chitinophagaceae bacterium]